MRLVCPNCAAQYEVDESAIPEAGRNVQCANCGDNWFQEPAQRVHKTTEVEPPDEDIDFTAYEDDDETDAPAEVPPRRSDPSVLDILRSEAERESAARNADRSSDADRRDEDGDDVDLAGRARAARVKVQGNRGRERRINLSEAPEDGAAHDTAAPRRLPREAADELPDIEELNSSLRSADDRGRRRERRKQTKKDPAPRRRSIGRRLGFYTAVLIALLMIAAYALEGQFAAVAPGAAPYLAKYVIVVDGARRILDSGFESVVTLVRGLMEQYL